MGIRRAFARPGLLLAAAALAGIGYVVGRSQTVCTTATAPPGARVTYPWTIANPTRDRDFRDSKFRQADLRWVVFDHCDFRGADLTASDLGGCQFFECDLSSARLDGADLRGVLFDEFTIWPAGFDPVAHGARLQD